MTMTAKRLILLEAVPERFVLEAADTVVALTAGACHELERRGIAYRPLWTFAADALDPVRDDRYWHDQQRWLADIDWQLTAALPGPAPRVGAAIVSGYFLKHLVDSAVIRCREAAALLCEPFDRVVFWPDRNWRERSASLLTTVLPLMCSARGLAYQECGFDRSAYALSQPELLPPVAGDAGLRRRLQWMAAAARRWSLASLSLHRARRPLTLLFLHRHYDCGVVLEQALKAGHRCLMVTRRGADYAVVDAAAPGPGRASLLPRVRIAAQPQWQAAVDALVAPDSSIWQWPNEACGVDVAGLLSSRLRRWAEGAAPAALEIAYALAPLLERERVDFVLTSALVNEVHQGGVLAAHLAPRTGSVLIAHGDGPDAARAWDLHELFPVDHYFVPNAGFVSYFEQRRREAGRPAARVHAGSERWSEYERLDRRPLATLNRWDGGVRLRLRRPPLPLPSRCPLLLYVCAWPEADWRYLDKPSYDETWYYQLQQAIVRVFRECRDYNYVLKLYPDPRADTGGIRQFIDDLGASHILVSRAPLVSWLPWASRVLLDKPSTSLYQTALSGRDFHLLLSRQLPMWQEGLEPFRRHLSEFDTFDQAAAAVRAYLPSPPQPRLMIPRAGRSILEGLSIVRDETPEDAVCGVFSPAEDAPIS